MALRRILGGVKSYLGGVLIALDQTANAVIFGGFPDETLSSRLGRRIKRLKGKDPVSNAACAVLDALEENHCGVSIEETPTRGTDPHHFGKVIRERPRKEEPLRKISQGALIVVALASMSCAGLYCLRNPTGCIGDPTTPPTTTPTPPPPEDVCAKILCPPGTYCDPKKGACVTPPTPESPKPPSPSPTAPPSPVPPSPVPPPPASPCPPPVTVCPAIPEGFISAPGNSAEYQLPKPGRCYAPVRADSGITFSDCYSCADLRWQNIKGEGERPCAAGEPTYGDTGKCWKSHWLPWWPGMTEAQKKRGLLNGLPAGFINRDCDLENADGTLQPKRNRESGYLGPVCPREVPGVVTSSPCPPSPTPPPPTPPPTGGAPPLTESGNYPVPVGSCPPWFRDAVSEVGIGVLTQRKCAGRGAPPDCTLTVLNATEKSVKPYCEHSCYDEAGRYALSNCRLRCETVRACQQPDLVNGNGGIQMLISSPEWGNVFGDCDKQTAEGPYPDTRKNFLCHDRAENRGGVTKAKACEPDGSKCGPVIEYRSVR